MQDQAFQANTSVSNMHCPTIVNLLPLIKGHATYDPLQNIQRVLIRCANKKAMRNQKPIMHHNAYSTHIVDDAQHITEDSLIIKNIISPSISNIRLPKIQHPILDSLPQMYTVDCRNIKSVRGKALARMKKSHSIIVVHAFGRQKETLRIQRTERLSNLLL